MAEEVGHSPVENLGHCVHWHKIHSGGVTRPTLPCKWEYPESRGRSAIGGKMTSVQR